MAEFFLASSLTPFDGSRPVSVPLIPIRTLLGQIKPSYLNIDVEGAEYEVLPLVTKSDVRAISVEVHDSAKNSELIAKMAVNGFECRKISEALLHFF